MLIVQTVGIVSMIKQKMYDYIIFKSNAEVKGVFSKPSGKMIVLPNFCFLS